jgi:glycosyltransferase involved in cell wall biosynthesis
MVARLECAVKGQALVLQVLSEPVWRERDWSLSIFGKGPDEAYLRDLIEYVELRDKVQMCGFADNVRSVWSGQQILIMASSGEGKPLALTEAMLCGRPAVVTDVGGNAELVSDGVTGFVAQSATLAGVRDALERSWVERNSWEEMGARAHDWIARALDPPPGNVVASAIVDMISG